MLTRLLPRQLTDAVKLFKFLPKHPGDRQTIFEQYSIAAGGGRFGARQDQPPQVQRITGTYHCKYGLTAIFERLTQQAQRFG